MRRREGQYLVEFSITVIIFIMVAVAFIELALASYNYRLMNTAAYNAARLGVTGATDEEMINQIFSQTGALYPTAFLKPDVKDPPVEITPDRSERMRGVNLNVKVNFFQGVSMMGYYVIVIELPIEASMPMTNDIFIDTDGDGQGDLTDGDDDNDGVNDTTELANGTDPKDASSL